MDRARKIQNHKEILKLQLNKDRQEECTFQPNLLTKKKNDQVTESFQARQNWMIVQKQLHVKQLEESMIPSFKPVITKKTKWINKHINKAMD